jgi:hypothetical protein
MKSSTQRNPTRRTPAPKAAVTEPVKPSQVAVVPPSLNPALHTVDGKPVTDAQAQELYELTVGDPAERADKAAEAKAVADAALAEREASRPPPPPRKAAEHASRPPKRPRRPRRGDKVKADTAKRATSARAKAKRAADRAKERPRAVAA